MITMNSQRACINDTPLNNEDFYYISDGTWYVKGSLCWLETNCGDGGALMLGVRASDNQLDGELCSWDEFDIYDKNRGLVSEHVEGADE